MIIVRPYKTKFRLSLILHHMNLKKKEREIPIAHGKCHTLRYTTRIQLKYETV